MIDDEIRVERLALAERVWSETWAEAVVAAGVRSKTALSGAPIAEYKPERLTLSPMTGRGFATGVEDAAVLAQLLAERRTAEPISATLACYETARLPIVRALVTPSNRISAEYVSYATVR